MFYLYLKRNPHGTALQNFPVDQEEDDIIRPNDSASNTLYYMSHLRDVSHLQEVSHLQINDDESDSNKLPTLHEDRLSNASLYQDVEDFLDTNAEVKRDNHDLAVDIVRRFMKD